MKFLAFAICLFCLTACFLVVIPLLLSSTDFLTVLLGLILFLSLIGTLFYQLWESKNGR